MADAKPVPTYAFKLPPAAPRSFYAKAFGIGFLVGAALEFAVIKSNYYEVMRQSEARRVAKERMALDEGLQLLEEFEKRKREGTSTSST
ncbi:hypothetical protein HDU85_002408 [Gaertneriomyces sp. JEL0708]|nr:hypothetical protein BC832DRAFT_562095 [Gaertneriomyces semiglobifer]KAJ3182805.1 hypothetical protein HDU85_002408 [Gaertneriomyces sp. JEL0708]